ncbi:single-strand binding protein [Salinispora tropica CNB-440]|uniref:Single-strand binding protein n=1 Tax=Salinispora tropica (strain ATCC BAA-916 / DSM 44818 / JCM 13857 / NBRC 105044 / CNB-440) TaxID=369723 RepID=A4XAN8_SALTO|nr:single-strand binding protein [Salinispora tropica CNB-440]
MFDTHVTVIGTAVTAPEWRRTTQSQTLVANFKVASTARRLDRESGRWVDGNSLRLRVNCWRRLAEGVAASVMVGDPVIVSGRLYTRDWTDDAGSHRTHYELEAVAVGHDLSRGRGRFLRNRPATTTSNTADPTADPRVPGEQTESALSAPADRQVDEEVELAAPHDHPTAAGADVDPLDDPTAEADRGDAASGQTDGFVSAGSPGGPAEPTDGASRADAAGQRRRAGTRR